MDGFGSDQNVLVGYDEDGVDLNRNYDINWIFGDELLEESVVSLT